VSVVSPGVKRRLQVMFVLLAAAIACAVLPPAAVAAPAWLAPAALTAPTSSVSSVDAGSSASGDVTAAWLRWTGSSYIVEAATRPAGGRFTVKQLQALPGLASDVKVAVNRRGDSIVAWRRTNATPEIWASTRTAGGSFTVPQAIASVPGQQTLDPAVAINDRGDMMVVWRLAGSPSGTYREQIYGAFRASGGSFITAPISTSDAWNQVPRVSLDPTGKATVVWSYWNGNISPTCCDNIARVRVRAANGTLGAQRDLSAGAPTGYPMFATVGIDSTGNAIAVWSHWNGTSFDVQGATRAAASDNWNQLPAFGTSASASYGNEPQVAVDVNGNAVAIWRAANGTIQVASRAAGGSFGAPQTGISAPSAFSPHIAIDPAGNAIALWQRQDPDGTRIESSVRPLGGSFGGVKTVSGATDAAAPALGVDGKGNAFAIWPYDNRALPEATDSTVQYAAYDASPPTISMTAPVSGKVGQPLGFSARTFDVWSPVTTTWAFGDGRPGATGTAVSHVFGGASAFNVSATARDAVGNAASTSRTVQITTDVDADGDGFSSRTDCNDKNARINPKAREIRGNKVDENCDGVAQELLDLTSSVLPTWLVFPTKFQFKNFQLKKLQKGWTVTVSCKGGGCPFKSKKIKNKKVKKGGFDAIRKIGRSTTFKPKQTLTVKFTAKGYNTKFAIFKLKAGKIPSGVARCQTRGKRKLRRCR
jgi:hypothetical protein